MKLVANILLAKDLRYELEEASSRDATLHMADA